MFVQCARVEPQAYSSFSLTSDQFKNLDRPVDKPFRLNVSDVFKGATGGFSIAGRISAGYIRPGDKVLVMPAGNMAGVKSKLSEEGGENASLHVLLSSSFENMGYELRQTPQ